MSSFSSIRQIAQVSLTALAGIVVAAAASAYGYHFYQQRQRQGEPPLKRSMLPILGLALEMGSKPLKLFQNLKDEFGEIFGLITLGNRMFIITDPHSYPLIINANPKELSYQEFFDTVESKFFGVHTHLPDPAINKVGYSKHLFADSGLIKLTERMQLHLIDAFQEVKPGTYGMYPFLTKLIFRAAVAALFDDAAGKDPKLYDAFCEFDKVLPVACAGVDVKYLGGAAKSRAKLLQACVNARGNESLFIASRWENLTKIAKEGGIKADDPSKLQLAMMWASAGNTMPATFWVVYNILSNPSILQRVKEEIEDVCGPTTKRELIPLSKLNKLVLLNACITETLRFSSGSLIMRIAKKPISLTLASGKVYHFRKGDTIGLFPPLTHMDNEIYENAANFVPDRWLVGSSEEELMESSQGRVTLSKNGKELPPGMGYLPFGGGASVCPGRKFARNEIKTLVVYFLKSFNLSLDENRKLPEFDGGRCGLGIFPPKEDISINVSII